MRGLKASNGGNYTFWSYPFWLNPIIVGIHGVSDPVGRDVGILESVGTAVEPASLFDAQLKVRTGSVPSWLSDLHTEWETLRNKSLSVPNILAIGDDAITLVKNTSVDIDLSDYFKVLYSETASYSASSADTDAATAGINGGIATITGVAKGSTTVTLTGTTSGQST